MSSGKTPPRRSLPVTKDEWFNKLERLEFLKVEGKRRTVDLEVMAYGAPDILFPKGMKAGVWDQSKLEIVREPLDYEESDEQYAERQNRAIYELVTERLTIVKDDRMVQIRLIPKMAKLLADLFFGRIQRIILWANRGGGKSLLASLYMWLVFTYKKSSCINMGGSGNQARRVYDYTKQYHHCFPGLMQGMLSREPLLQLTEMRNGSKLICATSVTTAIGEHVANFLADEASILPGTLLSLERGFAPIEAIEPGQAVIGRLGEPQEVVARYEHPYAGRALWLRPFGNSLPCWITEEHRVWAVRGLKYAGAYPTALDCKGVEPEWVPARELRVGDLLCFPRFRGSPQGSFRRVLPGKRGAPERRLEGPDFWRLLGYWVGDGSAAFLQPVARQDGSRGGRNYPVTLHLSVAKEYFLDDAASLLRRFSSGSVSVGRAPSRGKAIDVRSSSDQALWTLLRNEVSSGEERAVPLEWLCQASDEALENFLLGYVRTDGHHVVREDGVHGGITLSTTAPGLAQNVLYCLNRLGLSFGLTLKQENERYGVATRDSWTVALRPHAAARFIPAEDFKAPLPKEGGNDKVWYDDTWCYSVVREIAEKHYEGPVYDLKVEGDPSFAAPACAVLHNCTDRPGADEDLARAMQGALSEPGHSVFLLSTFHLPVGFFADIWDHADELGFTRVTWNCFDTMERCTAGLEFAKPEDPLAVESFCKKHCSLSWKEDVFDQYGNVCGQEWRGCCGQARNSEGWFTREQVLDEQRINQGTRIFPVEHCCFRPQREGNIYNKQIIDSCLVPSFDLKVDAPKMIGIDWGLTQCAMVLLGEWTQVNPEDSGFPLEGVGVIDVVYMSNRLVDAVIDQIKRWQEAFGDDVVIRADGSHPYCNKEVATHGYRVIPVHGDRKLIGEDNLARWLGSGRFRILAGFDLFIAQMHNLRRSAISGKQLKKNREDEEGDHGPDACKFALLSYDYVKWQAKKQMEKQAHDEAQQKRRALPGALGLLKRRGIDGMLR